MYVCIMKNDDRIVELLAEMVYKLDLMIDEFKVMNSEIKNLQKEQHLLMINAIASPSPQYLASWALC